MQQQEQQPLQQPPLNERIVLNWTDEETIKFIELYQMDASHLDLGRRRKNRGAYQRMSTEMEKYGYFRSADQLIRKMKRLRFDYKRAREKPDGPKEFKYFDHMDLMFKQQSPLIPSVPLIPLQGGMFSQYVVAPRITPPLKEEEIDGSEGASTMTDRGEFQGLAKIEDIREVYDGGQLQATLHTSPHRVPSSHDPLMDATGDPACPPPPRSPVLSSVGSSEVLEALPEDQEEVEDDEDIDDNNIEEDLRRRRMELDTVRLERSSETNFVKAPPAKRKRLAGTGGSDMANFLVGKVLKMQENTERQYVRLLERQMVVEEQRRRDNQEFQLKLVSLLTRNLPPQVVSLSDTGTSQCQSHQLLNRSMAVQAVRGVGRLAANSSFFFCCDMQEKFKPTIRYFPEITTVCSKMVKAADILDIPVIVTEQYPKALGNTVQEIDVTNAKGVFAKTVFSMVIPEVEQLLQAEAARKSVVLFGIETQVCVQQTALDLVAKGYDVHVVADAVSSRTLVDRMFAFEHTVFTERISVSLGSFFFFHSKSMHALLDNHKYSHITEDFLDCAPMMLLIRMRQSGVYVSTSESVIFELLGNSKHPKFKEVQPLIKESAPDSALLNKL